MPEKKTLVLHPFIFALYPVLFYYELNQHELWFFETLVLIASSLFVALLLFLLLKLILKNSIKAGVLTSFILVLFFFYEAILTGIASNRLGNLILKLDSNLFWIYGILLTLCIIRLYFWSGKNHQVTKYLNAVAAILIVFPLVGLVSHKILSPKSALFAPIYSDRIASPDSFNYIGPKPDIYYIIMDGYLRKDVMTEFWGFDNTAFTNFLTKRGFYVAAKSRSNYSKTVFSLPSSLNMEYLPTNLNVDTVQQLSNTALMEAVGKNRVVRFLKSIGYKYIHLSDGTEITKDRGQADVVISNRKYISLFSQYLLNKTIFKNIKINSLDRVHIKRNNILNGFDKLEGIPKINDPTFTFAHFIMPHEPQAFDENGDVPNPSASDMDKYFGEVFYANKKLEHLVNSILAGSDTPPIILIQGDHGYPGLQSSIPDAIAVKKRYSILNAYFLPWQGKEKLYESISPVNSFRIVFDHYFGTQFGLLEDKSYLPITYATGRKFTLVPSEESFSDNGSKAWISSLQETVLKKPNFAEAHALLGRHYILLKRYPEATVSLTTALRLNPNLIWPHIHLAQAYLEDKKYSMALDSINQTIRVNPDNEYAHTVLGRIRMATGHYNDAIFSFKKVLKINPLDVEAMNELGKIYSILKDKEKSLLYFKKVVLASPSFAGYNNLGTAYALLGLHNEAIINFKKALEINPDSANIYLLLGNAQLQSGRVNQAKVTYETGFLKHPEIAEIHKILGMIYSQRNENPDKVIYHFQEYLRILPNQPDAAQIQSMIQAIESGVKS
jgi:tetratricopeptide (TPR) repeat protein